jgi:hypothetical protein
MSILPHDPHGYGGAEPDVPLPLLWHEHESVAPSPPGQLQWNPEIGNRVIALNYANRRYELHQPVFVVIGGSAFAIAPTEEFRDIEIEDVSAYSPSELRDYILRRETEIERMRSMARRTYGVL